MLLKFAATCVVHGRRCGQVSLVNFAFTPMHLRVPVVATVGFGWCAYLSYTRGPRVSEGMRAGMHGSQGGLRRL
jgi:hypothetical protein